jgi:hypothetical protein
MAERTCSHRWMASRVEVETLPVQHVCVLAANWLTHFQAGAVHVCSCGAKATCAKDDNFGAYTHRQ